MKHKVINAGERMFHMVTRADVTGVSVSIQFKKLYGRTIVVNSITDALLIFIFYT
jgi:hypothetical protein